MKRGLSILYLTALAFSAMGSKTAADSNKYSVGIYIGSAIPMGGFAPSGGHTYPVASDSVYGFAKTGFHYNVIINGYFAKHLSFVLSAGGNINSFNAKAYSQSITYYEPTVTTASARAFYTEEYMAGLSYYSMYHKFEIHSMLLSGIITSNYPTITTNFSATASQPAGTSVWSVSNAHRFGLLLSIGAKYKMGRHLWAGIDVSYTHSKLQYPSYNYSETLQNGTSFSINNSLPTYMLLGIVEFNAGVSYYF